MTPVYHHWESLRFPQKSLQKLGEEDKITSANKHSVKNSQRVLENLCIVFKTVVELLSLLSLILAQLQEVFEYEDH